MDLISDWLLHAQLVQFCIATQIQYLTSGVEQALSGRLQTDIELQRACSSVVVDVTITHPFLGKGDC